MKTKLYLIGGIVIGLSLSLGTIAEAAFVPISVPAGGTGSTTLTGIIRGNGTAAVGTVVIGSNLTWDGTTLSATGGGSSFAYPFPSDSTTTVLTLTNGASIPKLTNLTSNGFVKTSGGNGTLSIDTNTYLTGNQTITLSGDVSGSGATSITTAIGANKVTVGMLAQAAANTILGNPTGSTANIQAFATSSLGIALSDTTGTLAVNRGGTGVATLTGIPKGNGTSAFTVAANGTDYTLITANSCGAGQHVSAVTAAGVITCSADTGAGGTGLATTSPTLPGGVLWYNGGGAGFASTIATSTLSVGSSLTSSGTLGSQIGGTDSQLSLNLSNSNSWTALQKFANASSTLFSNTGKAYFGATATTTIDSVGNVSLPTSAVLTVGNSGNSTNQAITIGGTGQGIYAPGVSTIGLGGGGVQFASFNPLVSGVATTTPGSLFSIGTNNGINFRTATSTFSSTGGIDLAAGCFAVAGVCVGGTGGGGSGTVGAGTTGQFPFYNGAGTTLTATSTLFITQSGNVGVGTTTPWAKLSVSSTGQLSASTPLFSIASTTNQQLFTVYPGGYVQAGPLASQDTAYCSFGKQCFGYFGTDNTLSGTNIEVGNYSPGTSAYTGFTALNNLDDSTGAHYAFWGITGSNYNDPTFSVLQAFPNQMQMINSDGQILIQANLNATTTVPSANNIVFTVNGAAASNEVARITPTGLGVGTTSPTAKVAVDSTNTRALALANNGAEFFSASSSLTTSLAVGTSSTAAILNLGNNTASTQASTTIRMGRVQIEGMNSTGALTCSFPVGTTWTTILGACTN